MQKKNEVRASESNSIEQLQRQELASLINSLKAELAALKIKSQNIYLNKTVKKYIKKRISGLDKEIADLTKELDALIAKDETLAERYALLNTVKGIGENTARLLVTCLPELGSISREAIVALVGLAPYNCDSGKREGYRSIRGGRFHVRNGLYMAALSASRYNPRMKAIYQRMLANGKKPKQALVAVMRKMLIMMNAMVNNNTPWSPEI